MIGGPGTKSSSTSLTLALGSLGGPQPADLVFPQAFFLASCLQARHLPCRWRCCLILGLGLAPPADFQGQVFSGLPFPIATCSI